MILYMPVYYVAEMDYVPENFVRPLSNLLANELIIETINDDIYEGSTDEKFLVIAEVVNDGFNGRVTIQPASIEISIQDDDLQPGKFERLMAIIPDFLVVMLELRCL